MAREARNSRGPIFENKEIWGGRKESNRWKKKEEDERKLSVTKLGEMEEREEKYKRAKQEKNDFRWKFEKLNFEKLNTPYNLGC